MYNTRITVFYRFYILSEIAVKKCLNNNVSVFIYGPVCKTTGKNGQNRDGDQVKPGI